MDPLNNRTHTSGGRPFGPYRTNQNTGPVPPPPPPPPSQGTLPWVGSDGPRMYPGMAFCLGIPRYPVIRFIPEYEMVDMIIVTGTPEATQPNSAKVPLNHQDHCAHCLQHWVVHPVNDPSASPAIKMVACPFPCGYCEELHPEKLCPRVYASRKKLGDIYPWPNNVHLPAHIRLKPTEVEQEFLVQQGYIAIDDEGTPQFTQICMDGYDTENSALENTVFGQATYEADRLTEYSTQFGRGRRSRRGHRHGTPYLNQTGFGRGRGQGQPFGAHYGYQNNQNMGYVNQNAGAMAPFMPQNQFTNAMPNPYNPYMSAPASQFGQTAFGYAGYGMQPLGQTDFGHAGHTTGTQPTGQAAFRQVRNTPATTGPRSTGNAVPLEAANCPTTNPLQAALASADASTASLAEITRRERKRYNEEVRNRRAANEDKDEDEDEDGDQDEEEEEEPAQSSIPPKTTKKSVPLVDRMTFSDPKRSFTDSIRSALPKNGGRRRPNIPDEKKPSFADTMRNALPKNGGRRRPNIPDEKKPSFADTMRNALPKNGGRRRAKYDQQKRNLNDCRQTDGDGHNP